MNAKYQRMCAWSGIVLSALFGLGLWPVANFFPPHAPTLSATDIATIYQQNTNGIRLGMAILILGGGFFAPFIAVVAYQIRRIERGHPLMTYIVLIMGTGNVLFFFFAPLIWTAIAFRPDHSADLMQFANDLGWITFIMGISPFVFQVLSVGFAIMGDKSQHPIFPRWVAYLNFWLAVLTLPSLMLTFFKIGPFAWNGLLAFYVPAGGFFVWIFVMFFAVLKAVDREEKEAAV